MGLAFMLLFCLVSAVVLYVAAEPDQPPGGVSLVCHERYFMIAVDQSFTKNFRHFEAVGDEGAHAITEEYASKCGYSVQALPRNDVQLRASYFSCNTKKEKEEHRFRFNLVVDEDGKEVVHALQRTCALALPWSTREVTCEVNYMEVSLRSEITCPASAANDWDNLKLAHSPSSDWQVTFQRGGAQLPATSLNEARDQGYAFDLTDSRLVFRAPYGRANSFTSMVDGVPVEMVHATLFSRQSWLVLLVDLVAACSVFEAVFEDEGYMSWETPDVLYPGLRATNYSFGLGGQLLEQAAAEEQGYLMEKYNNTVEISIPYDAEGGHRKSVFSGDLFEIYTYDFYLEQISVDEDAAETRVRMRRLMRTPLLKQTLLEENRTVPEEQLFKIYLGDIPQDVQLVSAALNGQLFRIPPQNYSGLSVAQVIHPNHTSGFTLTVPFGDSPVTKRYFQDYVEFKLDIQYTLKVTPENQLFNRSASYVAVLPDRSPPHLEAFCSDNRISFKLQHKPSSYKWVVTVGTVPLTTALAARHGFIMRNDSEALHLHVPLLSKGYTKTDFSLLGFMATFELLVRDQEKLEVASSVAKTCPFFVNEFIDCSPQMTITALVDLTQAVSSGAVPSQATLLDKRCGPVEADSTRALFSFHVHACATSSKIWNGTVAYKNEILYNASGEADRVLLRCTYPVGSFHSLFAALVFKSDTPGVGHVIHTKQSVTDPQTTEEASVFRPKPMLYSSARYLQLSGLRAQRQLSGKRLIGAKGLMQKRRF